jgi:SAM-dependent methyltransferase
MRPNLRVLDLGCGPGANTWFLCRDGYQVSGIDGSPSAIEICKTRLKTENLQADLRIGDITKPLPWGDGTFDAVVDCVSLYANPIDEIRKAITQVRRVLKPNGLFIWMAFSERTWGFGSGQLTDHPYGFSSLSEGPLADKGYVQFFTESEMRVCLKDFSQVRFERISYTLGGMDRFVEIHVAIASGTPT